jgi:hypothetical protein
MRKLKKFLKICFKIIFTPVAILISATLGFAAGLTIGAKEGFIRVWQEEIMFYKFKKFLKKKRDEDGEKFAGIDEYLNKITKNENLNNLHNGL